MKGRTTDVPLLQRKLQMSRLRTHSDSRYSASTVVVTATTFVDASPLATPPPNLPPLPTGTFSVPIAKPSQTSGACLSDQAQSAAWACADTGSWDVTVHVEGPGINQLTLQRSSAQSNSAITYGPQPPQLRQVYDLRIMIDRDDPQLGPAFFFWDFFDKIVVVPEDAIPYSSSSSKRSTTEDSVLDKRDIDQYQDQTASAGDRPWFCIWNSTVIEAFFYVNQNISQDGGSYSSVASSAMPTAAATSSPSTSPAGSQRRDNSGGALDPEGIYPRLMKLTEKRHSVTSFSPYCQQMQVLNDGNVGIATDNNGSPIVVNLTEQEPHSSKSLSQSYGGLNSRRDRKGLFEKRAAVIDGSACYCEWMSD